MLRRNSPEPTSATSASEISQITSKLRKRLWVQPSAPPRPPVFKISLMSVPEALMAGVMPKTKPVNREISNVNPSTRASKERSTEPSRRNGGREDHHTVGPPKGGGRAATAPSD